MGTPAQAFDHIVQIVSGPMEMHTLQINATPANGVTFNAGALISLNTSGAFQTGAGTADLALWAINGTSDYDVTNDGVSYGGGSNILTATINAYPATGGFELFTTEYDKTAAASLLPGTFLQPSAAMAATVTTANTVYSLNNIVGVVSRGIMTDQYGKGTLYFWPTFLPKIKIS